MCAMRAQKYSSKEWMDVSWIQIHATMIAKPLQNNGKQSLVCGGGNWIAFVKQSCEENAINIFALQGSRIRDWVQTGGHLANFVGRAQAFVKLS